MASANAYHITALQITNPEEFRDNVRNKLKDRLQNGLCKLTEEAAANAALNLERGIYNFTLRESDTKNIVKKWDNGYFVQIYADRLRTVCINLGNDHVVKMLTTKQIKAHELAFMTHQEIQADKWNPLIEKKTKRDASKCDKKIGASTAMFTCSRCQSKNCTYYEMQTRSADEPATIFITCLNCDKHWRN